MVCLFSQITQKGAFSFFITSTVNFSQTTNMKSTITISAVVLLHAVGLALISGGGGCHSSSGYEDKKDNGVVFAPARPVEPARTSDLSNAASINGSRDTRLVQNPLPPPSPPVVEHTPPPPPPPPPTVEGRSYKVRSGDTLWRIAKREKITRKALAAANGLSENANLKERQIIIIPGKSTTAGDSTNIRSSNNAVPPEGTIAYVVKQGDVLGTIALKNKSSVAKIRSINNLTSDKIRLGQTLYIPVAGTGASTEPKHIQTPVTPERSSDAPPVPDGGLSDLDRVLVETAQPSVEGDAIPEGVPTP